MADIEHWLEQVYRAGGNQDTLDRVYDEWARDYDEHLWSIGNPFIAICAAMVGRHLPDFDVSILDAGCGTGNLAQVLYQTGYRHLTGLDPSPGMLEIAKRKNVCERLIQMPLGAGHDLPTQTYDGVVSTGVLTSGHAPPAALDDMLSLTRPGGFVIFSLSETAKNNLGFSEKMSQLSADGRWRMLNRSRTFDAHPFSKEHGGIYLSIYVYRKQRDRGA